MKILDNPISLLVSTFISGERALHFNPPIIDGAPFDISTIDSLPINKIDNIRKFYGAVSHYSLRTAGFSVIGTLLHEAFGNACKLDQGLLRSNEQKIEALKTSAIHVVNSGMSSYLGNVGALLFVSRPLPRMLLSSSLTLFLDRLGNELAPRLLSF